GRAEIAAVAGELMPDLRHRAVGVVGRGLDQDRCAAGAVSLVGDLLVLHPFEFAGALLHRAVDVVERHVLGLGRVDRRAQPRVARGIAAARLGGDRDFPDEPREQRAPLGVGDGFLPFDLLPLAVTGLTRTPLYDGTTQFVRTT